MLFSFLGGIGWGEILLIAFIVLLLFGANRIPELMKSLGKGIKEFKSGMKEVEKEIESSDISNQKEENKSNNSNKKNLAG